MRLVTYRSPEITEALPPVANEFQEWNSVAIKSPPDAGLPVNTPLTKPSNNLEKKRV